MDGNNQIQIDKITIKRTLRCIVKKHSLPTTTKKEPKINRRVMKRLPRSISFYRSYQPNSKQQHPQAWTVGCVHIVLHKEDQGLSHLGASVYNPSREY